MNNVRHVLEKRYGYLEDTVNSIDKSINTVNREDSLTVDQKINKLLENDNITSEGVAQMLAEGLGDKRSLPYYIILAKEYPSSVLLETLHYVNSVAKGKIIHYKPAYFLAVLRNKGYKTKFKKE